MGRLGCRAGAVPRPRSLQLPSNVFPGKIGDPSAAKTAAPRRSGIHRLFLWRTRYWPCCDPLVAEFENRHGLPIPANLIRELARLFFRFFTLLARG